jgi:hypothetical protein
MFTGTEIAARERRLALQADAAAHRRMKPLHAARRHHRAHGEPLPRLVWLRRRLLTP